MKYGHMRYLTGCALGLLLLHSPGASAQRPARTPPPTAYLSGETASRPAQRTTLADATRADQSGGISTTQDNQILLELRPGDAADPNPVDLEGRSLVFTPDGHGGYSRSVEPLAREDQLGDAVADGALVQLESFMFDFAGQTWGSFYVSRHGLVTFGGSLTYSYRAQGRGDTMGEIAAEFVDRPTISPLYAPAFGGWNYDDPRSSRHVAQWSDRVVVTWIVRDTESYLRGVPKGPNRFQAVLHADGSVQFNYAEITSSDGIAGLFPGFVTKGNLIAHVADATDPEIPGYRDLLEVAIYESNTQSVIVEFTMRDSIPVPGDGTVYSYRLSFDIDEPYWTQWNQEDEDFALAINVNAGGDLTTWGGRVLESQAANQLALLIDISAVQGGSASLVGGAPEFRNDAFIGADDFGPRMVKLPLPASRGVDLSTTTTTTRPAQSSSPDQYEVFHNRGVPDVVQLACLVKDDLGDQFDFMVFHNEFEIDHQEAGSGSGTGVKLPCGNGRLKAVLTHPISMHTFYAPNLDNVLGQVAHEFAHVWSAYFSYSKGGRRESLVGDPCNCHWRFGLHTPAAFPPHGRQESGSFMSVVGPGYTGGYWRENANGTFTPGQPWGPSWLDLYAMGLADAGEVPDMFILRNLRPLNDGSGAYTGDKETVTIEQIVAAEGPRVPNAADSQKVFNVAFVYLVERGQTPTADLLQLHARYIDGLADRWFHFTGERSRITTFVPALTPEQEERYNETWRILTDAAPGATAAAAPFTDHPIRLGRTPLRMVHLRELRERIAALRAREGLPAFPWTDPSLVPGVTPVRRVHLTELRAALDAVYDALTRPRPDYTDAMVRAGATPVTAVHVMELRGSVLGLEAFRLE